jgi:hypothetical protein
MKKLIIICLMFVAKFSVAQTESASPVAWEIATMKNDAGEPINVQLNVSLENHWHIFASDAGGDGMAINTNVVLEKFDKKNKKISEVTVTDSLATEKPVDVNMEGFGIVHFFDKNFSYWVPIDANVYRVQAKITYQACNDKMCLAPVDKVLSLQVRSNK